MAIDKFESGKWYKYTIGTKPRRGWSSKGGMDFVLDEKPHQCKIGEGLFASFYGTPSPDRTWYWEGDQDNFDEVPAPTTLKRGDKVWVSDDSEEQAKRGELERIFLADVGGRTPFICTREGDTFITGDYGALSWVYAVPVETPPAPKKMTVKEICEKLGYDIEITKE